MLLEKTRPTYPKLKQVQNKTGNAWKHHVENKCLMLLSGAVALDHDYHVAQAEVQDMSSNILLAASCGWPYRRAAPKWDEVSWGSAWC